MVSKMMDRKEEPSLSKESSPLHFRVELYSQRLAISEAYLMLPSPKT